MNKNKRYILSIDQGTTSTKAIIYNKNFIPINSYKIELKQYFPHEGWIEQDPMKIWKSVKDSIVNVLKKTNIYSYEILSIGITNQRETTVLWNKSTGKPVYNAIVWQDRRTSNYCSKIKNKKLEKEIQKITGLIIDPYFSATKIKWLINNVRNITNLIQKNKILFGTIDSWILWKLTKGKSHLTDATNASRTMLFDIRKKVWSKKLLNFFKIPYSIMPKVVDNICDFGETNIFGSKIPISAIIGDQQSALIGQACFNKGMCKSTYGTGCFLLTNIGTKIKYSKNKLLTSIAYQFNGKTYYCIEGSIFIAGAAIQWLRDGIKIIKSASETEKLYKKADIEQNIYFIPAFTGIGAPHWQPHVRGSIYGINRNTGIPEIVNATIRSIGFQTKDLVKSLENDTNIKILYIKIDGGMVNNTAFVQFLSDILNIRIVLPKNIETTALGVAYLAGLKNGIIKNIKDINKMQRKKIIYYPKMKSEIRNKIYIKWNNALKKLL